MTDKKILILAGDGIGPEIMAHVVPVLLAARDRFDFPCVLDEALVGGCAIDRFGTPLPDATLTKARVADAVLLGAVGGAQWEHLPMTQRPERGLLGLRAELGLFANLRPAYFFHSWPMLPR